MRFKIIISILTILIYGCQKDIQNQKLEKPYIKSYQLVDKNCSEIIKTILIPTGIENENRFIKEIYELDVNIDSSIYEKTIFLEGKFVALILEPDTNEIKILNIIPSINGVYKCISIENDSKLIVNNIKELSNNMDSFKKQLCLGIDKEYRSDDNRKIEPRIRYLAGSSGLYKKWKIKDYNQSTFENDTFSNIWDFKRKDSFYILSENNDTLINTSFYIFADTLKVFHNNYIFKIWTYSQDGLILSKMDSDSIFYLEKYQ
jgi:hypothetical protein